VNKHKISKFEEEAESARHGGLFRDLWEFVKEKQKWWLMPFVVLFLLLGLLIFLSSTGLAPFIYTLF
jgi:Family of unknown function (DUF5989)